MTINNSAGGTVNIIGGPVDLFNTLTISHGSLAIGSSPAALTLISNATGSASVATLPSGSTISGKATVQRYMSAYRGYRLLAAPTHTARISGYNVSDLTFLKSGTFVTGSGGSTNGFDQSGNPTIYLFREDEATNNRVFTGGNWWGISKMNLSPAYNYYVNGGSTATNIPVGNGYMLFFRGSRSTSNPYVPALTTPLTTTFATTDTLNTGSVTVNTWFTPGSTKLSYTPTGVANSGVVGFNLVGNPYASTIDWHTSTTGGISLTNVGNTIYTLNANGTYGTCQWNGSTETLLNNGTRYIASGEGFFVQATAANPSITFTEQAKITPNPYNPSNTGSSATTVLAASVGSGQVNGSQGSIRLQMEMDSVNKEELYVGFGRGYSGGYKVSEDALYNSGPSKVHFYSQTAERAGVAINKQPLVSSGQVVIPLVLTAGTDGRYQIRRTDMSGIPAVFDIWLMDDYKKDSLDIRHNSSYLFDITNGDTSSYGSRRFRLLLRENRSLMVALLSFAAVKGSAGAQLSWTTANEYDYTGFTVERSIDGGKSYTTLDSAGSTGAGSYSYTDSKPVSGTNLYRLKLTDINDSVTYSPVRAVMYGKTASGLQAVERVTVYPNPTTGQLNYQVNNAVVNPGTAVASYRIGIYTASGQQVKQADAGQAAAGKLDVSALQTGPYVFKLINMTDGSLVGTAKFVKL